MSIARSGPLVCGYDQRHKVHVFTEVKGPNGVWEKRGYFDQPGDLSALYLLGDNEIVTQFFDPGKASHAVRLRRDLPPDVSENVRGNYYKHGGKNKCVAITFFSLKEALDAQRRHVTFWGTESYLLSRIISDMQMIEKHEGTARTTLWQQLR